MQENKQKNERLILAARLEALRNGRGWSHTKMAEVLGISRQGYARWAKGDMPEAILALKALQDSGVDLSELFSGQKREADPVDNVEVQQLRAELLREKARVAELLRLHPQQSGQAAGRDMDVVLRADEPGTAAALREYALKLMTERIIYHPPGSKSAFAVAEVRISGDEPGKQVMTAIRKALERIENLEGRMQKLVVGVTPALDEEMDGNNPLEK